MVPLTLGPPKLPFRRQSEKITVVGKTQMSESHKQELSCHRSHILVSGYGNRPNSDPIRNVHAQILLAAPTYIHTLSWAKDTSVRRFLAPGRGGGEKNKGGRRRINTALARVGNPGRSITRTERTRPVDPGRGHRPAHILKAIMGI